MCYSVSDTDIVGKKNPSAPIRSRNTLFSRTGIKSSSTVTAEATDCLASRDLKEHLMSLEDFRIKYNIQTKNVTKSVSFKLKHLLNASEFFSQKLISIFSLLHQLSLLSLLFNFIQLENKLVAFSLRGFSSSNIYMLALSHSNNQFFSPQQ